MYDQNGIGEHAELITGDAEIVAELKRLAMDQFGDVGGTEFFKITDQAAIRQLRHQDVPVEPQLAQTHSMKVIPMEMGYVNEIGIEGVHQAIGHRRIIPPGPPIGTPHQPGIGKQGRAVGADFEAGMGKDTKLHKAQTTGKSCLNV